MAKNILFILVMLFNSFVLAEGRPDVFAQSIGDGLNCTFVSGQLPRGNGQKDMQIKSQGWNSNIAMGLATVTNIFVAPGTVDDRGGITRCIYPLAVESSPLFTVSCRSIFSGSNLVIDSILNFSRDLTTLEVHGIANGAWLKENPMGLSLGNIYACQHS